MIVERFLIRSILFEYDSWWGDPYDFSCVVEVILMGGHQVINITLDIDEDEHA